MDIDLDFANRSDILDIIEHVPASIKDIHGNFKKHNTGVYCHQIPVNPATGSASIDYKEAEDRGYFKIDFLNVSIYADVKDDNHLTKLMNTEPLWELLEEDKFTDLLFHVSGHGNVLRTMKPRNIEQLAAVLAVIRPAKRYLIGKDWATVANEVWSKPTNGEYYFKKSHAISYSHLVVVHMNLLCEKIEQGILKL